MKKVLFIASDFPPLAGTNTQRIQNFVRYLPDSGWQTAVITQLVQDMALFDSKELGFEPAGSQIIRVANPDFFARRRRSKGGYPADVSASKGEGALELQDETSGAAPKYTLTYAIKNFVSQALKLVYKKIIYVPDAMTPWSKAACKESLLLLAKMKIDVIVTSIPAYSCHVAGLKIKKMKPNLIWVADFRDLWVDRPGRPRMSVFRRYSESKMEKNVVTLSDAILVASPAWKERLIDKYGSAISSKVIVLTNGFDSEKLLSIAFKGRATDKIVITNTGAMFSSETPVPFLKALGELSASKKLNKEKIEVRLIGYAGDEIRNINQVINDYELVGSVKLLGAMSHDECIVEQKTADILLLCNGMTHKETVRGKSFEYMATGHRIFALTPVDGVQASILSKSGTATIVNHNDTEGIAEALLALVESVERGENLDPDWEYINSFSRKNLTSQLATTLDSLLEKHSEN